MTTPIPVRKPFGTFMSRLLSTGLSVWMLGVIFTPALAATVPVDQSPLIIQRSLPPNLVVILDDSGSMAWDVMPDWPYLSDQSADGLRSSDINGVYYNPEVTYTPPPKADGTLYPDADFNDAWIDGFNTNSTKFRLGAYDGSKDSSRNGGPSGSDIVYSAQSNSGAYNATCNGYTGWSTVYPGYCYSSTNYGNSDFKYNGNFYYYSCSNGGDYRSSDAKCLRNTFFVYTVKGSGSNYTKHYVGNRTGACSAASLSSSVCKDTAADRKNVANWFSYYHTRMLMAQSGLMSAFSTLDSTFRVGFGSINGKNDSGLPADRATYSGKTIATVAPFGDEYPAKQKTKFWDWLAGSVASGGTPLLASLDSVGQYYQSEQPWTGMPSDPDYTTAAASQQLACRQSYTILTTDGFWNGTAPPAVGDVDGTAATITGPDNRTYTYTPAPPYTDFSSEDKSYSGTQTNASSCKTKYRNLTGSNNGWSSAYYNSSTRVCEFNYTEVTGAAYSNTLADYAMKYWVTDLRPDLDNEVPSNDADPAFWQHMATFTLGLGFSPLYADQTTEIPMDRVFAWANGDMSKAIPNFSWPKPSGDSINNIADLAHAGVNGHGGFYAANTPDAFAAGLKDALKRASERVGTGASLAANSTQLQSGTTIYQSNYWTAKWKGDLKALSLDPVTGAIASSPTWTASGQLPTPNARNIKTFNPGAPAGSQFVDFKVGTGGALPSLSSAQHTALSKVDGNATNEANLINYLRGSNAKEQAQGGSYRNRDNVIGDIVNSQPVHVGAPRPNLFSKATFSGSGAYAAFASGKANRTGVVYVASNDGMLHGFNGATGVELFAYLPGRVITAGVSALASADYGGSVEHKFFNDGEIAVADAFIGSPAAWTSVLVATTGRGEARTVYALDVTDPADVKFLWERYADDGKANSGYIGQMTGKPVIAQTSDGTWSVLLANGYNSPAGKSALLQFDLKTGALSVHKTTDGTGLAAPSVWKEVPDNGLSTIAYAGDASGNVWSFRLNTIDGSTPTPSSSGVLLFTAKDAAGNAQPITGTMLTGKDPDSGNTWVFFGTGRYLTTTDLTDLSAQSWYGLIVDSSTDGLAVDSSKTRTDLVARAITNETANGRSVTTLAEAADDDAEITGKSGWYIDLKSPVNGAEGERMVTANQFQGGLLYATTRIPLATNPCKPSGRGWLMAVDPFTGASPKSSVFDTNGDGVIDDSDSVGGSPASGLGSSSLPNNPIFIGGRWYITYDDGQLGTGMPPPGDGSFDRVSWRELIAQ